jgi:hypothetical protein
MKILYEQFKDFIIRHPHYEGVVCGYNEEHFLLAIETEDLNFFDKITDDTYIDPQYTHVKYRYAYEDECEILRQSGNTSKFLKIFNHGKEERSERGIRLDFRGSGEEIWCR